MDLKEVDQKIELKDDLELLNMMLVDSKNQPSLYRPGPYWAGKAKNAANEIKRCGIRDFRGASSHIGLSYADNLLIDVRHSFNRNLKLRIARWLANIYPLGKIFEAQVRWTQSYARENIIYAQEILNLKERTRYLLKKYDMPPSLLGGCLQKANIDGQDFSIHYLELLHQHDNIASLVKLNDARSVFEIGGGRV